MGSVKFQPYNQNLEDLFLFKFDESRDCDREYKFLIPDYQRQYSWVTKQVDELWNDFQEAIKFNSECFFLGFITLIKLENDKKYLVIDGQQRITTLVLMMGILYNHFKDKLSSKNYKKIEKYLFCKCEPDFVLVFESDENYQDEFYDIITGRKIFDNDAFDNKKFKNEMYLPVSESDLKQNDPKYKYKNTARFFYNSIDKLSNDELNRFVDYVFDKVNVITIVSDKEEIALKMFESLNDRGLELDNADIFKSWLYGRCNSNEFIIRRFRSHWNGIIDIVNKYDFNMNDFMSYFCYYKLKSNPRLSSATELKKFYFSENKVINISHEMLEFANAIDCVYGSDYKYEVGLLYIPWKGYVIPALAALRLSDRYSKKEKGLIIKIMHKFYYMVLIANLSVNSFKQVSFNLIEYIVDGRKIEDIEVLLLNCIYGRYNGEYVFNTVIRNLYADNVYNKKFLKCVMLSLEAFYEPTESDKYIRYDKCIHIDHIAPQKYYSNEKWDYLKNDNIDNKINSLGNMALLSSEMNLTASNCDYDRKIKIYNGNDNKIKLKSKFKTTVAIKDKTWSLKQIDKRFKFLYKNILDMLNMSDGYRDFEYNRIEGPICFNCWNYDNKIYRDFDLIKLLLSNMFKEKKFVKFDDIPKKIRNYKIGDYYLFLQDDIGDISREKVSINGITLYLMKSFLPEKSREFIKKYFNIDYDLYFYEEKNIAFQKKICFQVLDFINKKYGNEYLINDYNFKRSKSFIQFYKKNWNFNKKGAHFEVFCDSTMWLFQNLSFNVVLHLEDSITDEDLKVLSKYGIVKSDESNIALFNGNLICESFDFCIDDDNDIDFAVKVFNIVDSYIVKYSKILDDVFNKSDE